MKTVQFYNTRGWKPLEYIRIAKSLGATNISLKITDGTSAYWDLGCWKKKGVWWWDKGCNQEFYSAYKGVVELAKREGMSVSGWGYLYGRSKLGVSYVEKEANAVVMAARELGITSFFVDAEIEWRNRSKDGDVTKLCNILRNGGIKWIALESFKWPSLHPGLHWREWAANVDAWAPQVYWLLAHNAAAQLKRSYMEHTAIANKPFVPILPTFKERGWEPTSGEIIAAIKEAEEVGAAGIGMWDGAWFRYKPDTAKAVKRYVKGFKPQLGSGTADTPPTPEPTNTVLPCDGLKLVAAGKSVYFKGKKVMSVGGVTLENGAIVPIADFLTADRADVKVNAPPSDNPTPTHVVIASYLHVRSGPGIGYKIVGLLKHGTEVIVYEERDGWAKIGAGKWVSGRWIKEK